MIIHPSTIKESQDDVINGLMKEVEPEYRIKPTYLFKKEYTKWMNQGSALNFDLSYSLGNNLDEKLLFTIENVIRMSKMEQYQELFRSFKYGKQREYVFNSNKGENVGHQTLHETISSLQNYKEGNELSSKESNETVNTLKALEFLNETRSEMLSTLNESELHHSIMLFEDTIKECHSILMKGLVVNNGLYRQKQACAMRDDNTLLYYVDHDLVADRCVGLIDYYNTIVDECVGEDMFNVEKLFKLASYLAFNFVDIHPFSDGNGRMARLLANYVLSLHLPFPVTFSNDRKEYIAAVETFRNSHPQQFTVMLMENAFQSCLDFLKSNNLNNDKYNHQI
ncbi:predicted protein [Naegleria gruberi]|uniref:Predicted protein n=1 Tax=Naegleria gruberi TaxID=5762 RepID=D2V0X5_NAEGR|nr:uncharacterized protein NAEGRDRAFT_45802 [Naegleria gruberi]EFC49592.1 predicted protein [Naegleria gruberi]|eukprot:XP_002682336.1 predicted protein [Naegleria gruberi strain NEG-M]